MRGVVLGSDLELPSSLSGATAGTFLSLAPYVDRFALVEGNGFGTVTEGALFVNFRAEGLISEVTVNLDPEAFIDDKQPIINGYSGVALNRLIRSQRSVAKAYLERQEPAISWHIGLSWGAIPWFEAPQTTTTGPITPARPDPILELIMKLPAPGPSVEIGDVLDFRRDRYEDRQHLWRAVDEIGQSLNTAEYSPSELAARVQSLSFALHSLANELEVRHKTRFATKVRALIALRGPAVAAIFGVIGASAGGVDPQWGAAIGLAVSGLVEARVAWVRRGSISSDTGLQLAYEVGRRFEG